MFCGNYWVGRIAWALVPQHPHPWFRRGHSQQYLYAAIWVKENSSNRVTSLLLKTKVIHSRQKSTFVLLANTRKPLIQHLFFHLKRKLTKLWQMQLILRQNTLNILACVMPVWYKSALVIRFPFYCYRTNLSNIACSCNLLATSYSIPSTEWVPGSIRTETPTWQDLGRKCHFRCLGLIYDRLHGSYICATTTRKWI